VLQSPPETGPKETKCVDIPPAWITAVCVSIGCSPNLLFAFRSYWGPAPRHDIRWLSNHSRKLTIYPWNEYGLANDPEDRKSNGKTEFPTCLRPTDKSADPWCRGARPQIRSKGKQQIWAVSYRNANSCHSTATQFFVSGASPTESLVSVASHIQPNQSSLPMQGGPRNGAFPPANGGKLPSPATVPSSPTDQYETSRGAQEMYMNQPPDSSSIHPSPPLPYLNGHHPLPGAEWAMNSDQLEGPGMPFARGGSHPVPVQNPNISTASRLIDQQANSTTEGGDEGEVEVEQKYCFCDRVSYGEMIRCDDPNCEREWVRTLTNLLSKRRSC
jgi:hypothetical protein